MRRIFGQVVAAAGLVLIVVTVAGGYASRKVAEREAVNDAARTTDLLAEAAVQPVLEDDLLTGSPTALAHLDAAVRSRVLGKSVVRVKVWTPNGRIIYSDEPRIVGLTFALGDEERSVLAAPTTHAEVSDLTRPENRYELSARSAWPTGPAPHYGPTSTFPQPREPPGKTWCARLEPCCKSPPCAPSDSSCASGASRTAGRSHG